MASQIPVVVSSGQKQQLQAADTLGAQLDQPQGFGLYARDFIEITEPSVLEISTTGFLEIDETDGPNALMCYSVRVHPSSDQCLAETSSLSVMDYYDITESYALEIPATAVMEICETIGAPDFDIS